MASIHDIIASRIVSLIYIIGLEEDLTITGGIAKNIGVVANLYTKMGFNIMKLPGDPQIIGAIGPALRAKNELASQKND